MKYSYKIAAMAGVSLPLALAALIGALFTNVGSQPNNSGVNSPNQFASSGQNIKINRTSSAAKCLPPWLGVKHSKDYESVASDSKIYQFILATDSKDGKIIENQTTLIPLVFTGDCEEFNISLYTPWSVSLPEDAAIAFKSEYYSYMSSTNPEDFKMLILGTRGEEKSHDAMHDVPDVAYPFFPEDIQALKNLGMTLGKDVPVFKDAMDYQNYSADNDPFFLKDHPAFKKK